MTRRSPEGAFSARDTVPRIPRRKAEAMIDRSDDILGAAVQVAAAAIGYETHSPPGLARAVVDALAAAGWLCDPAELAAARARIAELEADLLKVEGFRADLADRCFRMDVELDELRARAAGDDHWHP